MKKNLNKCMDMKIYFSWVIKKDEILNFYEVQHRKKMECKKATTALCEESKSYVVVFKANKIVELWRN